MITPLVLYGQVYICSLIHPIKKFTKFLVASNINDRFNHCSCFDWLYIKNNRNIKAAITLSK